MCIHDDMLTNSLLVENSGEEASRDSVLWQAVQNTRFSRDPEPKAPAPCSAAPVSEDVPPFSVAAEIRLFFRQGVPLVLSSFLEWGVPPLAAMVIAGHVKEGSTALQASIGFARIFYTVTYKMPCIALLAYMRAVIPGCVGAGRADRIPKYFQRSMVLSLCLTIPSLVLQLFASPILRSVNVPDDIARAVGEYTCLMILTAVLFVLEQHLEQMFIALGYTRCDACIGLVTGVGVDVGCSYAFVYLQGLGMRGFALAELTVRASRLLCWLALALGFRLWRTLFVPSFRAKRELLFSRTEMRAFLALAAPAYVVCLAGWLVFELQLMALSNVSGVSHEERAAGAIWVQLEGALAASMSGWINVSNLRAIKLLGRLDAVGASRAFLLHNLLAALCVALCNVCPIVLCARTISKLVTNNPKVSAALEPLLWVLAVHAQTKVTTLTMGSILNQIGKPWMCVAATFIAFYVIAAPIAAIGAFTGIFTSTMLVKMGFCVGLTSVAQALLAATYTHVLCRLDWKETARMVHARAQSDRREVGRDVQPSADPT